MEKNRVIKFRGILNEKGMSRAWVEGSLIHITRTYKGEEDDKECNIYQIITDDGVGFNIDKETLGQFTGLKDKNGKEIYEGDIIKVFMYDGCEENYYIVFRNGEFDAINEDDSNFISNDIWNIYAEVIR